jgi:hypothetical protein
MTDPNGLLYMRNRFYSPYLCRFVNPDPTGFSSGMNFFAYANGNPVSYLDPSGLGAIGENQNLSWLNTDTTSLNTGANLFPSTGTSLFSSTGTSGTGFYDTASTTLGVTGIAQFGLEYGSGTAAIGNNGVFYAGGFYGNQYVSVTMVSDIARWAAPPLAALSVGMDWNAMQNGQISVGQFTANTTATGIGFLGPVGASFSVGYTGGSLIQQDVNGAVAGSFQILTDWYYHAPFGPNFADLPNNP